MYRYCTAKVIKETVQQEQNYHQLQIADIVGWATEGHPACKKLHGTLDPRCNAVIRQRGPRYTEMKALGLYTCLETTTPDIVH